MGARVGPDEKSLPLDAANAVGIIGVSQQFLTELRAAVVVQPKVRAHCDGFALDSYFTAADSNRQFGGTLVLEFEPAEH